jgi:hypothetical protein
MRLPMEIQVESAAPWRESALMAPSESNTISTKRFANQS